MQQESELNEIVRLVGIDSLSPKDRLVMEVARTLREDFLQQNAFVDTDAYSSLGKQMGLLEMILHYNDVAAAACLTVLGVRSTEDRNFCRKSGWTSTVCQ